MCSHFWLYVDKSMCCDINNLSDNSNQSWGNVWPGLAVQTKLSASVTSVCLNPSIWGWWGPGLFYSCHGDAAPLNAPAVVPNLTQLSVEDEEGEQYITITALHRPIHGAADGKSQCLWWKLNPHLLSLELRSFKVISKHKIQLFITRDTCG